MLDGVMNNNSTDRQDVLLGVAGIGLSQLVPKGTHAAEKSEECFGSVHVTAQSYCWQRFDLACTVKDLQDLALRYVELFSGHAPIENSEGQVCEILAMCGDHDLNVAAVGVLKFSKDHAANQ